MKKTARYDAIIVGAGHNGLIASCYLAMAGLKVIILEKNDYIGGATYSKKVFKGIDARVSVYSYLISLLPDKILSDLKINFQTRQRKIASYTPLNTNEKTKGLLISNKSQEATRNSFCDFTGNDREYVRYQKLQDKMRLFARKIWPTLLLPLQSKKDLQEKFRTKEERDIWEYIIEKPLSFLIEDHLENDAVRGLVFTDAKIGVSTFPRDTTFLQNKTFLYHIIGQGTGQWRVPVGGMGKLIDALYKKAQSLGVVMETSSEVLKVDHTTSKNTVYFMKDGRELGRTCRFVLFNTSSDVANTCLPGTYEEKQVEGSVFKMNMILKKLPVMKDSGVTSREAFCGTFHLYEGYDYMKESYKNAKKGIRMNVIPGEMYCHSLTDPSILSGDLQKRGFHALTLFGIDVPYKWFTQDNEKIKDEIEKKYLSSINSFIKEDIAACLATDAEGKLCIKVKSPLDLENSLGLPRGNIFHGNLTWPFAENDTDVGTWGVETNYENVVICGSSAKRGGAVSGIPGFCAAAKVLGCFNNP